MVGMIIAAILAGCSGNSKKTAGTEQHYPAFDVMNMDKSVKPGDDFFRYVNGTWLKNNPIPADKNSFSSFEELFEKNRHDISSIIETAATAKDVQPGSITDKIGTFYKSGMDTVSIEKQGASVLKPFLDKIESIKTKDDLLNAAAELQTEGLTPFFVLFASQDLKNSTSMIANTWQAGIGLPDRDYYFNNDESTKKIRAAYLVHVGKMFQLLKDTPETAPKNAETVMKIETQLAKASNTHVENQDPQKLYNKVTMDGLKKLAPEIDWKSYLTIIGIPGITEININQPAFIKELNSMLKSVKIEDWKTYLRWELINTAAAYLSQDFVDQNFDFITKHYQASSRRNHAGKQCLMQQVLLLGKQ